MPKVTEEHKERRKAEILEGARRCFARHGYEGATVARLEGEIGLSRGAIFNYYENKQALFMAIAREESERMTEIWLDQGFRALLEAITHHDTDWLAVMLESVRRLRTDPELRRQEEAAAAEAAAGRPDRLAKLRQHGLREDVPLESIAVFLGIIANGLALRVTLGDPAPDLDTLVKLVETGVAAPSTR
jgi:TetR/AcrR family transcriptional regulator, transcriptional repressor of aconitase